MSPACFHPSLLSDSVLWPAPQAHVTVTSLFIDTADFKLELKWLSSFKLLLSVFYESNWDTETFAIYRIEAQTADPGGIHYFSKVLFSTFTCVPSRIYSSVFQRGLVGRPCLPPSSIPSLSSIFPGLSFKDNCWNLQVVNRLS